MHVRNYKRRATFGLAHRRLIRFAVSVALLLMLAACAGAAPEATAIATEVETQEEPTEAPSPVEEPTEVPEPMVPEETVEEPDITAVSSLTGAPQSTFEGTFELYLRDAIAQLVALQREKLEMRIRYQDPEILEQDLGGLVTDVSLVEDRSTASTETESLAVYEVDIDVEVTFADGSTDLQLCNWTVTLERNEDNQLWYVVSPAELALFLNCTT